MKNIKTKHFVVLLIVGFFFYMLLIEIPRLFQNLILIFGYIVNLNIKELIGLKILTWIMFLILIVVLLIFKSRKIYKEVSDNPFCIIFNRNAILLIGVIAIIAKICSYLILNLQSKFLIVYLEKNVETVSNEFVNEIYLLDGYLSSGFIFMLLITFLILLIKLKSDSAPVRRNL